MATSCDVKALDSGSMTEGHEAVPIDGSSAIVIASRNVVEDTMVIASKNVVEDSEECMMEQLTALEHQQEFWRAYHRNSPTWAFFTTNDSTPVDLVKPQLMRCIICHPSRRETAGQRSTRCRKGVVLYNKEHGTSAMKRHIHAEHPQAFTRYKALRSSSEVALIEPRQPCKKRSGPSPGTTTYVLGSANPYKKEDEQQQRFLEDLVLHIVKSYQPISSVENSWLRRLVLRQCPRIVFPSRHDLVDEVIPKMVTKTMERHILPSLAGCVTATASFDLWMSRSGWNTYALVINFINSFWIPCRVTIGLFNTPENSEVELAGQLREVLSRYNLTSCIIACIEDEDSKSGSMTAAISSVASCEPLDLAEPYAGSCFGHAMLKCCEHATDEFQVPGDLRVANIKDAQACLQKAISWTKQSAEGRQEWPKACADNGLPLRMLKTPIKMRFASKVVFFQEALEYKEAITTWYARQNLGLQSPEPSLQSWAVARAVSEVLLPVLSQSVMNQTRGYWFLSDALAATLSLSIDLRNERWIATSKVTTSDGGGNDFDGDLLAFKMRMREEVLGVLEPFLSFATVFSRRKAHNMLALMLDPRFKGLGLVRDYVGADKVVGIVFDYDMQVVLPLLMQCFKRLHPTAESQQPVTPVSENSIFGAQASAEEVILAQLKSELSLFRRLHVADGECDGPLLWWREHEKEFPNVAFLARQILGIVGSQVELERLFSISGVITSLQRCKLGIDKLGMDNLESLVLISKNWPDETRNDTKLEEISLPHFLAVEDSIIDDNEYLIEQAGLFED